MSGAHLHCVITGEVFIRASVKDPGRMTIFASHVGGAGQCAPRHAGRGSEFLADSGESGDGGPLRFQQDAYHEKMLDIFFYHGDDFVEVPRRHVKDPLGL